MEIENCLGQVLRSASEYIQNPRRIIYLMRTLEILQCESSKQSFIRELHSRDQLQLVECLTFMTEVIRERRHEHDLIDIVVKILLNLCQDKKTRKTLCENLNICPPLIELTVSRSSKPQMVELLQELTQSHRISVHQTNLDNLLEFLVQNIISQTDGFLCPSLGTLANLCRNNNLVQSAVRNKVQSKKLLKVLANLLDNKNPTIMICAMSIITSLCLHNKAEKEVLFDKQMVENMLVNIFNILLIKFRTNSWRYASDLLLDLLRYKDTEQYIVQYKLLSKSLHDLFANLRSSSDECIIEVFELMLNLSAVPSIRKSFNRSLFGSLSTSVPSPEVLLSCVSQALRPESEPLVCCLFWANHQSTSSASLDFLRDSIEASLCEESKLYPLYMTVPAFISLLHSSSASIQTSAKVVQILMRLCSDEQSRELLSQQLEVNMLHSLVEQSLSESHLHAQHNSSEICEMVLLLLDLALRLRKNVPQFDQYLSKTLQDSRFMNYLVIGMTSHDPDLVYIAIKLLCYSLGAENARPCFFLANGVACTNKERVAEIKSTTQKLATLSSCSENINLDIQGKENIVPHVQPLSSSPSKLNANNSSLTSTNETSVQNLIEKMETTMKTKDAEVSQLLEVYDHRIKSLQLREQHLNELVEAKTLALAQADRVINQYRVQEASHSAQLQKMQNVLKESDRKKEQMIGQMNEERIDLEKRLDEERTHGVDFKKRNSQLTEKLLETEGALSASRTETASVTAFKDKLEAAHEKLRQQHDTLQISHKELEEQNMTLSKQLKEKETVLQKLTGLHNNLETEHQRVSKERGELEKEKEEMEGYVDNLRQELRDREKEVKKSAHKVNILEDVNQSQEEKIKELTEKVAELRAELQKHSQIVSFIDSLNLKK